MNGKIKTMPGGIRWLSRQQKCMLFLLLLTAGTYPAPANAAEGAAKLVIYVYSNNFIS
jgi:hypothetical protein